MATTGTYTRNRILHLLRRLGGLTAAQLAAKLGISASGVRQQLALLGAKALVTARPSPQGPGRPTHVYELTAEADEEFPKAYEQVALSVLEAAADVGGPELVTRLLVRRRAKLLERLAGEVAGLPPAEQVFRIAAIQEARGYFAHAERDNGRLRLIQRNCPLLEVAKEYPQFCAAESQLYAEATGQAVRRVSSQAEGAPQCCFEFTEPAESR
jgi:predicted ArsR family transcriptional regulator